MKIDLGCGMEKAAGFLGADREDFDGVDFKVDLGRDTWPWKDGEVEEFNANHVVEHLTAEERIHFANELYRCLKEGGTAKITTPHWASARAYGDLDHKWPPVAEWWYFYLDKKWREGDKAAMASPVTRKYNCDFVSTFGYGMHESILAWAEDRKLYALTYYKEAATDLIATLTKR